MKQIALFIVLVLCGLGGAMAQKRSYAVLETWNTNGIRYAGMSLTVTLLPELSNRSNGIIFTLQSLEDVGVASFSLTFKKNMSYFQSTEGEDVWNYALVYSGEAMPSLHIYSDYVTHTVTFYRTDGEPNINCSLSREDLEDLRQFVLTSLKKVGIKKKK